MRLRSWVAPLAVAGIAGIVEVACGYAGEASSVAGPEQDGAAPSAPETGGNTDARPEASPDSAPPPGCGVPTCALPTVPAGWELVLLDSSGAEACPAGFDSADAIENPTPDAGACTCAACVTTGTSCSTGSIPTAYDMGGKACGTTGTPADTNAGTCNNQVGGLGQDARIDPPTAALGTCTAAAAESRANVAADPRRVCTRQPSTCSTLACEAAPSMQACLAAPGDVACPAGGPSSKHLLGSDFTLACAACGCSITSATCGGELDFYPVDGCLGTPVKLTVGACTATFGAGFRSTKWKPLIAKEICATIPGAPTTTIVGPQTICCP